jgi:PAS domain S-box-containing protein
MNKKGAGRYSLSSFLAKRKQWSKKTEFSGSCAAIAGALNAAVEIITSHREETFDDLMSNGLRPIAEATGLDRIAIYRLLDGKERLGQTYLWTHGKTAALDDGLVELPNNPPVTRWLKILTRGDCINARVDKMAEDEAAFLTLYGIKSVFFVPIFTHNKFWGVVTFSDRAKYRYFDDDCLDMMCSAGRLYANAFMRMEMTRNADKAIEAQKRRERLIGALNKTAIIILSQSNETFEDAMTAGVKNITDIIALDRLSVWRNFSLPDGLHTSQIYRWDRDSGGTTEPTKMLVDTTYASLAPRWEKLLAEGGLINSPASLLPEAAMLKSFGVVSAFVTPVFMNNAFWGFVLFEDRRNERYFDTDYTETMRSAAFLCTNAILRAEMAREIADTNEFNRTLIDTAPFGLTVIDEDLRVIDCNEAILKLFGSKKQYYLDHFSEFMPKHQVNGENSEEKAIEYIKRALKGEKLVIEWMHRSHSGEPIPSEITLVRTKFGGKYMALGYQYDLRNIKKMEREVADINEFNRGLLKVAPVGITIIDEHLNVIDCNDTVLEQFKTTKEQYTKNFWNFSPEYQSDGKKSTKKAASKIRKALKGERVVVEWTHRSSTGEIIPSEITLVRAKLGDKYVALGYQYDLRNIRRMEENILEAEQMASAIKEASPISYVLFDESLNVIDCNDATLRILDCPDKKYLLAHYWDTFFPESPSNGSESTEKAVAKKGEASVSSKEKVAYEWVHRSFSGELIPTENTLTEIIHKGQKFIISFKYDLRATKRMMENIHEQSELLRIRLEQQELISEISKGFISSGDSETYVKEAIGKLGRYHKVSQVFIFRINYQHNNVSPAYYWAADGMFPRMAEFDLFSIVRSSFPERLPDCSTVPVIACPDVAASKVKAFLPLLAVDVHAFICAPLYVEGLLWGIISVEQCTKPRQWTENEKGFVAMTASTIAGVIMRSIYNTMLQDALHKATEASKAKGEFLSNMSHEMRTPLNAIIGMTAIGKNAADTEHKDYALDKIDDASTHLLGVINDVLDMSKIEANMLELSPEEFVFEKMLQKVVSVVNFRVDEKKQKFRVNIDHAIPRTLIGDDQRLAQVITNLLGNAIKFTPEEGTITLDAHLLEEKNDLCTIKIAVVDTGIGISPEQQARLFRSFQQAETSTTRKFGGTGLGLAISKSIVELMDGRIWIESEPEKGSTFVFTIRVKRGKDKTQGLLTPDLNIGNVRIMVIDDDPDIREYISVIVKRAGALCDTANSGEEALRLVEQNGPYNIYFVDWKMPGLDGITLTAELKKKAPFSRNSVAIMISAIEWNAIEGEAKKAGVDKFMSKPLFPSSIMDTISECLGINQTPVDESPSEPTDSFTGRCILLVEDVEINREIVLTLLEPTHLEIDCAENGIEAVRKFTETPRKYDAIFMDVQMPEMDGYEATRRIRAIEAEMKAQTGYNGDLHRQIPIIAMTANVFREDIEKSLAAGMDDHIGKPLDFDIVMEKLRTYLPKG